LSLLGLHFSLNLGPTVATPASAALMEALRSVEVTHTDEGRSGFQIVFGVGRGAGDLQDYALLADPLVAVGNRVVLGLTVGGIPSVLFDGFVTTQQFKPSMQPGASTLTLTGEDASYKMDQEERNEEYPGQGDEGIVQTILARYAEFGVSPEVTTPDVTEQPTEDERTSGQQGTDYAHLTALAAQYGFAFYIVPGPTSGTSTAVWGPPVRTGSPQPALSVNLGATTNVDTIDFSFDGLAAELYTGRIQDRGDNSAVDVSTSSASRPTLATGDPLANARTRIYRESAAESAMAFARAQALTDASVENAVEATGELDTGRYGGILQARSLVDLRGAGFLFDGTWYVKNVTHKIERGTYKQAFTLAREATGSASSTAAVQ
jgi:phage protein D